MNNITTATNLQSADVGQTQTDARKYFNNFYAFDMSVGAADDAVTAFFENYTNNKQSAMILASAVIYTAKAQNIDPMSVLSEFAKMPPGELTPYLTAFINASRAPTSFVGVKVRDTTNPYVNRSILL